MWVFGYGSLMWNPGFSVLRSLHGVLRGYQRSFCVYSHYHRGTVEEPGLVLGLTPGGQCQGILFEVEPDSEEAAMTYLRKRELCGYAYCETTVDVESEEGMIEAYTYIADLEHQHYAGEMPFSDAAEIIMRAKGEAGLNRDYLMSTIQKLEISGIIEPTLHTLLEEIEYRTGIIDQGSGI